MAIQNITDGVMEKVDVKGTDDCFIVRVQDKIEGVTTLASLDKAEAEKLTQALAEWIATQP